MASAEPLQPSRDAALRALLVDLARQPDVRVGRAGDPFGLLRGRELVRVGLITVAVLAIVAVVSALAIRATLQIRAAEFGGAPGVSAGPSGSGTDPTPAAPTLLPGKLLGRFTSADGADQRHVIHPDGLAIATAFTCSGKGAYSVSIAHYEDFDGGGPDRCSASDSSRGNKGRAGETTVTIHSGSKVRWTLTIVGVPETYVTPQPVSTPTTSTGALSRFCTAADLTARFEPVQEPHGVTEVAGGQIAFTDRSSSGCTLAGYPMVRFLDHGTPLGHHTLDALDSGNQIESGVDSTALAPGATAYVQINWYLRNYYPANGQGACAARSVSAVQVDLANHLAGSGQTGSLIVALPKPATACLNGPWGTDGRYGQISSTVFLDYSELSGP